MITQNWLEIGPAYGRDYKNQKEVVAAFKEGKDFEMLSIGQGGTYCSIKDFAPKTKVFIRYARQTKVAFVTV